MIDKGDLGALVGGLVVGGVTMATGVGAPYIIAATTVGAIGGHRLADSHNYHIHRYNPYK